jgi:hypothetical protein
MRATHYAGLSQFIAISSPRGPPARLHESLLSFREDMQACLPDDHAEIETFVQHGFRLVAPLGRERQLAGDIHMRDIALPTQPLLRKLKTEDPAVIGQQSNILAAEYAPQGFRRHPDFTTAGYLARLREEPVKVIVGAGNRFVSTLQDACAMKFTKISHDRFSLSHSQPR